jgi:hypothetical protein
VRLFGKQAIRRSQEHFTWPKITSSVSALYEDVLSGAGSRTTAEANQLAILDRGFETLIRAVERSQRVLRPAIRTVSRSLLCELVEQQMLTTDTGELERLTSWGTTALRGEAIAEVISHSAYPTHA